MMVLVLRGLTGIAMAAGMLPPLPTHVPVGQHQAHPSHHQVDAYGAASATQLAETGDPDPASHPDHPAVHAPCNDADAGCIGGEHHSTTCSACEICHSAMLDAPAQQALVFTATGIALPLAFAQFVSAPAARAIKPPIA